MAKEAMEDSWEVEMVIKTVKRNLIIIIVDVEAD